MEQLFFEGKAYLKINSLVKTPLHEFMAAERSGLWAPEKIGAFLQVSYGLLENRNRKPWTLISTKRFVSLQTYMTLSREVQVHSEGLLEFNYAIVLRQYPKQRVQ